MYDQFYRSLYRIRRAEEAIAQIYPTDKIKSPIHLSIGQEVISVGVCEALGPTDVVFGTYRGHALYLAKGGSLKKMMAELYGKVTGCAQGKGGSMHLVEPDVGMMGTSAVVGTTIPNAVGYAYACRYRHEPRIVVSFFGDGATEEGVFHESLNFAALKKLPMLFICENNFYAIHTHQSKRQSSSICDRVRSYGIPAEQIENNDGITLYHRVKAVVETLRSQQSGSYSGSYSGPYFFECLTYRWGEHVGPGEDLHLGYRTAEERQPWVENDAVKQVGLKLETEQRMEIEAAVEQELAEAIAFAETSSFPEAAELLTHIYKGV
jgi:TPP-dependent pyruvate/acetoin dehydrogenase alpha subunit